MLEGVVCSGSLGLVLAEPTQRQNSMLCIVELVCWDLMVIGRGIRIHITLAWLLLLQDITADNMLLGLVTKEG